MSNQSRLKTWIILGIILSISFILADQYVRLIEIPTLEARRDLQQSILNGTAVSPYQFRVLVPWFTHGLENFLGLFTQNDTFGLAYIVFDILAIFSSLAALYIYLQNWFPVEISLIGSLIAALSMLTCFRDHYFQPWSLLEPAIIAFGLHLLYHRKFTLFGMVIILGSLNRETTIFLVVAYFLSWALPDIRKVFSRQSLRWWLMGLIFFCLWAVVFLGIRILFGETPRAITVIEIWRINIQSKNLLKSVKLILLFLGVFWLLIPLGLHHAHVFIRKMAWLIPLYLGLIVFFSIWYEVRLLMTLYPIIIPIGLSYLHPCRNLNIETGKRITS